MCNVSGAGGLGIWKVMGTFQNVFCTIYIYIYANITQIQQDFVLVVLLISVRRLRLTVIHEDGIGFMIYDDITYGLWYFVLMTKKVDTTTSGVVLVFWFQNINACKTKTKN
jgi:hypothetical protein